MSDWRPGEGGAQGSRQGWRLRWSLQAGKGQNQRLWPLPLWLGRRRLLSQGLGDHTPGSQGVGPGLLMCSGQWAGRLLAPVGQWVTWPVTYTLAPLSAGPCRGPAYMIFSCWLSPLVVGPEPLPAPSPALTGL